MRSATDEVEVVWNVPVMPRNKGLILLWWTYPSHYLGDMALAEELGQMEVPVVLVQNKMDLADDVDRMDAGGFCAMKWAAMCDVSSKTGAGLHELERTLAALLLGDAAHSADTPMLFRAHQKDSMQRAATSLEHLLQNKNNSPEFLAVDLREALHAIGEITGETTPEDILDRIFASFCIGK